MSDRGIIFTGSSMRKLLADEKPVTRRLVLPQPATDVSIFFDKTRGEFQIRHNSQCEKLRNPYGLVGTRLWVKETFRVESWTAEKKVHFAADDQSPTPYRWTSPFFMPRALSRATIEILDIRIEHLQEITEADAKLEGASLGDGPRVYPSRHAAVTRTHRDGFAVLWDRLNRNRGAWASNPWVWRIEFRRLDADRIVS